MIALVLALVWGCGADPCEPMCEEAATRTEVCLAAEGLGWEAAGYLDRQDYVHGCDTWAWEQRLLARDAREPAGTVDATCEAYREVAVTGTCEDFDALEW